MLEVYGTWYCIIGPWEPWIYKKLLALQKCDLFVDQAVSGRRAELILVYILKWISFAPFSSMNYINIYVKHFDISCA